MSRRITSATAAAAASLLLGGCGGGGGGAAPDARADASVDGGGAADAPPEVAPPRDLALPDAFVGCAEIAFDPRDGFLPISNTLRLAGTIRSRCAGEIAVEVRLDGAPLPPIALAPVPIADRYGVELGPPEADGTRVGRWHLATNLWCSADALVAAGAHLLEVRALSGGGGGAGDAGADAVADGGTDGVAADGAGDGPPLMVAGTGFAEATFSGIDDDTEHFPWRVGAPLLPGSEPANPGKSAVDREHTVSVELGGAERERHYVVAVPPGYDPGKPAPVVFVMHGWSRNPDDFRGFAAAVGMRDLMTARGYLVVSPDGHWTDASSSTYAAFGCLVRQCEIREGKNWYTPVMDAIARDLSARYAVDARRVSVAGFSCGASYAYCLGLSFPGKLAAAVVMDGNQGPITTGLFGPYGYFPVDARRQIALKIVTGAARTDWEKRFKPGGTIVTPWCMDVAYDWSGSTAHAWFPEFNPAIADFIDAQSL